MTITIHSTSQITKFNGIDCRVWEGETDKGIKLHAFIPRVCAKADQDLTDFERDLQEHQPPTVAIDMRMIL